VAVGASGVAVAGTSVGADVIVGFAGVLVKVGRNVLVGIGVPTGPRATRVPVQLDRAMVSNIIPSAAQLR
jgi:carbonic anhydrase/acetyltransferase-like protein (isoleucine patch superfamily)